MSNKPDFTQDKLTYGERYGYAMTIENVGTAQAYLLQLTQWHMRVTGRNETEAREIELQNIGYYAGYYDAETRTRVYRLFNTTHPVLGDV